MELIKYYRSSLAAHLLLGLSILFLVSGCNPDDEFETPLVTTLEISNVSFTSATIEGNVTDKGSYAVTARGFVWGKKDKPIVTRDSLSIEGDGLGIFSTEITGLEQSTKYYIRSYATNQVGTSYGAQKYFWTLGPPVVRTYSITGVTSDFATVNGGLAYDGGEAVSEMGICVDLDGDPDLADEVFTYSGTDTVFVIDLENRTPLTTYYVRPYAINANGTAYGDLKSFNTLGGTVDDVDGNSYGTVQIGEQIWLSENLKTTKFNDNTPIDRVNAANNWIELTTSAYCDYANSDVTGDMFGRLYNWYTANSGNICPVGWHVPSAQEWETLDTFLGKNAAVKIKEESGEFWPIESEASNETNFSAIPAGYRDFKGSYNGLGRDAAWWSTTANGNNYAWLFEINTGSTGIAKNSYTKNRGHSIRCIMD